MADEDAGEDLVTLDATREGVAVLRLNRPEKHNAFNPEVIDALTGHFDELRGTPSIRAVILEGAGHQLLRRRRSRMDALCRRLFACDNVEDARALADMLHKLHSLEQTTICLVNGAAMGGALGLIAACDVAVAVKWAEFRFSEVRLGLTPAVVSPYIVKAIGPHAARMLFVTGRAFDTETALRLGLIHTIVADIPALAAEAEKLVDLAFHTAPGAVRDAKKLVDDVMWRELNAGLRHMTADRIADPPRERGGQRRPLRVPREAQTALGGVNGDEGIQFFPNLPLVGRSKTRSVFGWGTGKISQRKTLCATPHPDPPPQGGRRSVMTFTSLLIANRGEIACRIIKTALRMGLRTVAVYSEADAKARHVALADEAVFIGPPPPRESYLKIDAVIAAAKVSGAEAIHPGYGFLSENADFAEACAKAGLVFVGPPASAIRAMGLKGAAKALMQNAGVPVVPGYHGDRQETEHLAAEAEKTGYPVLIKAVAGGGGKGMRRVDKPADFAAGSNRRGARPKPPSATTACSSSATSRRRGTSRSRFLPTPMATPCRCSSAIARCSAATKR